MINQNRCSRCTRITVHVQPEWVFTFVQNMQHERGKLLSHKASLQNSPHTQDTHFELSNDQKVSLFKSYLRGRSEIFAQRWENKQGKSGYSPACSNEWDQKLCNKPKTKCSECPNQSFLPLTDKELYSHLTGKQIIGLYPLDRDSNCNVLVFDFDKADWKKATKALCSICESYTVPHIVEISRSGNGTHLWVFFEDKITAMDARNFGFRLLDLTMETYPDLSFESYDRIFPNQDILPTNGFGNLIALPLQYQARKTGGSIFVDNDLNPYSNQWQALANTKKLSQNEFSDINATLLQELGNQDLDVPPWEQHLEAAIECDDPLYPLQNIVIANRIYFELVNLPTKISAQIKRIASFSNPEFFKRQSMRFSTIGTPRYISCANIDQNHLSVPRGCMDEIIELFDKSKISYQFDDKRQSGVPLEKIEFLGKLKSNQKKATETLLMHDTGILHAPTAFGKTIAAISIIASRKVSTLILVHSKVLLDQWTERLRAFIQGAEVGFIGGGKNRPTLQIDVATYQSLVDKQTNTVLGTVHNYGQIIIDECHHLAAPRYELVLNEIHAKYTLGLTATPNRRDGHQKIMIMQSGPVRCKVKSQGGKSFIQIVNKVEITDHPPIELTDKQIRPHISLVYEWLSNSSERNQRITNDIAAEIRNGACCLVLTERRNHAEILHELLSKHTISVLIHGGMKREERIASYESINDAEVIVATGKYIGEGFDFNKLDTLFLALPISWSGLLSQYVGRIHRIHDKKQIVKVYDYVDVKLPMLERMFKKRAKGYKALGYSFPLYSPIFESDQNQREVSH